MAAEGGNIVRFTYTSEDGEIIPRDATHVFVDVTIIPEWAFDRHQNIVEVICHEEVEKIERHAFNCCPSLRRVIMPGVKIAEWRAFYNCTALEDVECGKLEIIEQSAFYGCKSLRSINLPSAEIVEVVAFYYCIALKDAKFGSDLQRFDQRAFWDCTSLERITIPLKDGMFADDNIFLECGNLKHVDLVEVEELRETIAALNFEEWRNDMNGEITSITQILPNASAGGWDYDIDDDDAGEKALVIRGWIRTVLDKMIHYQVRHQRILDEATTAIQQALPQDLVMNNVLSFLALPPHRFGVEDHHDDGEEDDYLSVSGT